MTGYNKITCEYCGGDHFQRDCHDLREERSLASAPCSAFQLRLLEAMGDRWVTSGIMADRMWPDKHHPTPWSKRSAKWQKMGAMLNKLKELGYVTKKITEHGQKEWLRQKMPNDQAQRPDTTL